MELRKTCDDSIVIGFAGDVMVGRLVNDYLTHVPPEYLWGDVLPLMLSTDLNIINLEAALTYSEREVAKVFNFKADPTKVEVLKVADIDVVNLANNHVLDYDKEGLLETLSTLEAADILYTGAGEVLASTKKPVVVTSCGMKIGILGVTDNEPGWKATGSTPGIHYIDIGDIGAIKKDIAGLKENVDVVIMTMHWGPNMRERPTRSFVDFAHQLVDCGVDIIHGHSAHIFQGIEIYRGKLIMYDTGDFVDDYYVDPYLRNDRSFFFLVEVDRQGFRSLQLIPTCISSFQVNMAQDVDLMETMERMRLLSREFKTPLEVKDEWFLPYRSLVGER